MAKYRVTISSYQYRTVDVEANSEKEAEEFVQKNIDENENEYVNYYCGNPYDWGSYVVNGSTFEVE